MKYNVLVFSFFVLIISINTAISNNNYIINGDTVYIDNPNVYLSANPHTLSSSGWVYFNLTSKVYTGNIDACWGFNTSVSKPTKAEVYSPHWVNTTSNHEKTFYNVSFIVYTGDELDYGNSYNINYKYTTTESIINDNGTTYTTSNAAFDSYTTDGTNYTIYWYTRHDNYYLWEDFSQSFNSVIHDYKGYNKWYYIKNVPCTSNKEYTVRAWIDVLVSTEKQSGKYYFAIKPSNETISQAISNEHFYNLDPWWNATWSNRKKIILTGNASGAQTDYQILLNVTYDSDMQSGFDDLRFCNETHKLDAWLKLKVDSSYAFVWVEFPTTPASGVNQTYYMYYGNAVAASYWDGDTTFLFFDDAESGSFYDKWTDIISSGRGAYSTDDVYAGTYSIKVTGDLTDPLVASTFTGFSNAVFEAEIKQAGDAGRKIYNTLYGRMSNSVHTGYRTRFNNLGVAELSKIVAGSYTLLDSVASSDDISTWQHWELVCDGTTIESYYNGNLRNTATDSDIASGGIGIRSVSGALAYADNVCIRKYAADPPTYAFGSEEAVSYMPPNPISLMNTTGNFWINHTWSPGSSNVTNSYNVSVNDVWHNTSPAYYNDTYAPHAWQNITVYAFNTSGMGTLSAGSINQNTQIPNNPITITNTSDWSGDAGETVYVDYDATDIDSDTATFSCDRTDLFTDFDTSTGTGNWTATANIYYVDFGVSDGHGSSSNYTMTLIESSVKITLLDETKLIMSEITTGLKSINMGNYLVYAFIIIGILLIILGIQIITNNIYRG